MGIDEETFQKLRLKSFVELDMLRRKYYVEAAVIKSGCEGFGMKVGDKVHFDGTRIMGRCCYHALEKLLPAIRIFAFIGPSYPSLARFAKEAGVTLPLPEIMKVACPDPIHTVIFEIRKVKYDDRSPFQPPEDLHPELHQQFRNIHV